MTIRTSCTVLAFVFFTTPSSAFARILDGAPAESTKATDAGPYENPTMIKAGTGLVISAFGLVVAGALVVVLPDCKGLDCFESAGAGIVLWGVGALAAGVGITLLVIGTWGEPRPEPAGHAYLVPIVIPRQTGAPSPGLALGVTW